MNYPSTGSRRVLVTMTSLTALVAVAGAIAMSGPAGAGSAPSPAALDRCSQPGPYELPHGDDPVDLDPAEFTSNIDNPYWPMEPGTRWVYRETAAGEVPLRVDVRVTHRTRMIEGIESRVVHDVVTERGEIIENTFDWYAQDSGGSIWYMGEFTREYENGVPVNTEGSFEHGKDGAQAGVIVPAKPRPGCSFRQEYYEGEAEDRGRILSLREDIKVSGDRYRDVLSTSDWIAIEPFVLEHKFYAPGVGPVMVAGLSPDASQEQLVSFSPGG